MPSTYTGLGVQLMNTGEKSGTWGTLTNTNWNIIEQIAGGFTQQAVTDGADTDLSVNDGTTGATLAHRVIEFTGSLSASRNVTIPLDVQTFYIVKNSCDDSVVFKYVSGSGNSVTFAAGDTKIVSATANDATNPDLDEVAVGEVTLTGTQTLTNKTLTSPKIGTSILDTNGNELALLTATGSAVNEFTIANAATTAGPTLSATGEANVPINITPKGTGDVFINPPSTGSLAVKGNATNGGTLKIFEDTDLGSYHTGFTTGDLTEDIVYTLPLADAGTSGDCLTSNASGVLSWTTISGGVSWQAVVTGATQTAVAGNGYFINTTSNACTLTLPAGTIGDEVNVIDYAGTFDTNNLTVAADGSEKIHGSTDDLTVAIERAAFALVFSDSTQGWLLKNK
jgi:hypothetical protein